METTYQIEWWNIVVSIVTILIGFGIALTNNRVSNKIIGLLTIASGVGLVTYYALLGLWLGEQDWTIYTWAVGLGIVTFMIGMGSIVSSKEENK